MEILFSLIALIICWVWIEIIIFFSSILDKKKNIKSYLSINKFRWILRLIILVLFFLIILYMYFFQTEELKKTIILCLGLIK